MAGPDSGHAQSRTPRFMGAATNGALDPDISTTVGVVFDSGSYANLDSATDYLLGTAR
jgi:hypothetical protein